MTNQETPSPLMRENPPAAGLGESIASLHPLLFVPAALALVFFSYQVVGGMASLLVFSGAVTRDNVHAVRWTTAVAQVLLLLLPTMFLATIRFRGWEWIGRQFSRPHAGALLATAVCVIALQHLLQGYMALQDSIQLPLPQFLNDLIARVRETFEEMLGILVEARSVQELFAVLVVVALIPSVCEEVLFRGLVQHSLSTTIPLRLAASVAGIIFALFHLNPFTIVPLVILGGFLGLLVSEGRSLWYPVLAHAVNNGTAVLLAWFTDGPASEATTIPPGTPSVIVAATYAGAFVVFLASGAYFVHSTRKARPATQSS